MAEGKTEGTLDQPEDFDDERGPGAFDPRPCRPGISNGQPVKKT
jgi:hypothetical protein